MTKFFCALLVSCFFLSVSGQEKELKGQIMNATDIEGIHVLNISSKDKTITDGFGMFSINASSQDTLLISSIKYMPTKVVVTPQQYWEGKLEITLQELVNELAEVFLGRNLSGNLEKDIKNIQTQKDLDFYDVGIPGFRGEPEEKIPNLVGQVITPTSIAIEPLYKYLSGYYKELKTKRKWLEEGTAVEHIKNHYTLQFFVESFEIPEDWVSDFLQYCIETSSLQSDFSTENYAGVLTIFEEKAPEYVSRLQKE